jgi:hypothetical protein
MRMSDLQVRDSTVVTEAVEDRDLSEDVMKYTTRVNGFRDFH